MRDQFGIKIGKLRVFKADMMLVPQVGQDFRIGPICGKCILTTKKHVMMWSNKKGRKSND